MSDNLESYFKKNLSDDSPGDDNWNVPSDEVWEKVLPEIQKEKGVFIPMKYLYLIAALLLIGFGSILWFSLSPDNAKENQMTLESVEEISATPEELVPLDPTTESSLKNENPNTKSPEQKSLTSADILKAEKPETSTLQESDQTKNIENTFKSTSSAKSPEKLAEDLNTSASHSNQNLQGDAGTGKTATANSSLPDVKNELSLFNQPNTVNGFELGQQAIMNLIPLSIEQISTLRMENTVEQNSVYEEDIAITIKQKPEPFDNKGKFGIGVFFAPTFTSTYVKGKPESGEILTGNMYQYSGSWGFEFRYFLSNRFTLVSGIGKSEIVSWSKSMSDFGYDPATEHDMGNGEKENTSAVPMQTPFGEINTEITYRMPSEAQFPNGEIMNSEMETHQELRYLSIPLGLELNILPFNRFNWFAGAGVQYNRALKDATQFSTRILHDGQDMDVVAEQMENYPVFTENYLSFNLNTGINYQISKMFQVSASAGYFGNITKVNIQNNMSTYVNGFNMKFGFIYLF